VEWEIVYEPMPPKVSEFQGQRIDWGKRLAPVKAAPGTQPRVMRTVTMSQKDYYMRLMREYLRKKYPLEKWEFTSAKMQDVKGGYGIWACYRGMYTPAEYEKAQIKYKQDSDRRKKEAAGAKVRREAEKLKRDLSGVIRPFPGR